MGTDTDGNPCHLRMHYECHRCNEEWTITWSSEVDDDCPECGARHCSPTKTEDVT